MYKNDIRRALALIEFAPGGPVSGLLSVAKKVNGHLQAALAEVAANNDRSVQVGRNHVQEYIRPLAARIAEISPSGTAIELAQLQAKFDQVLSDYAELEAILRPGRQALAELAGAFDVTLQQHARPPALIALLRPAITLGDAYEHYRAIVNLFAISSEADTPRSEDRFTVEILDAENLVVFAEWMQMLSSLSGVVKHVLDQKSDRIAFVGSVENEVVIASIESGSPIQIVFKGGEKALQLFLAMLRDVVRTPYQHFTSHGRLHQSMETLHRARELGIDSEEAISALKEAVVHAAETYKESIDTSRARVGSDGDEKPQHTSIQVIAEAAIERTTPLLPPPDPTEEK